MSTLRAPSTSSNRGERPPGRGWWRWLPAGAAVLTGLVIMVLSAQPTGETSPLDGGGVLERLPGIVDAEPAAEAPRPLVVGYVPYWEQRSAVADALQAADLLTTVAPWWYAPTEDGGVVEQHPDFTDTGDDVVQRLRGRGLRVMPTIANHRDGEWDFEVVPRMIADPEARTAHVDNLTGLAVDRGFDGIVVDYELLGADDRDNFTAFLTELAAALHERDLRLAVALHAQTSDEGSGGHNAAQDYRAIGRVVDEVHLMAYDLHYDESEPGPIAPLPWVDDVLEYATAHVPPEKVLLGVGLFGYDWPVGGTADGLQLHEVAELVADRGGEAGWDEDAAAPWLTYEDDGVARTVWYEDAPSVAAKLALVEEHGLGGAFLWRLGGVPDDVWEAARGALGPQADE
ncbi:MAG TPA: glycosyl hydrolase family 18 protein [Euzebyales bacterium]|nr:glycosyl hydrolase family 18 protein [Euzebyales bacterium]